MSQPEVFIIESLEFDNEQENLFEGRIISQILAMSGKNCKYCYIRTKRELKALLEQFASSHYRYLHLSCHGNRDSLFTTLDPLPFSDLGPLLKPHLRNRRLFVSACLATNEALADTIMPNSGCYSILGPDEKVYFWRCRRAVGFVLPRDVFRRFGRDELQNNQGKGSRGLRYVPVRLKLIGHANSQTLPPLCFGVLVSLVYNRGASMTDSQSHQGDRKEMRDIRDALASGHFEAIPILLRSMGGCGRWRMDYEFAESRKQNYSKRDWECDRRKLGPRRRNALASRR